MAHYTGSNQEGNKARKLAQEREDQKRKFEEVKKSIKESSGGLKTMDDIFQAKNTQMDDLFRASTVGLQSLEDFKQKQLLLQDAKRLAAEQQERAAKLVRAKKEKDRKAKLAALSFSIDDEEGALLITPTPLDGSKKRKLGAADGGLSSASADSKQSPDGSTGASDNNGADQPPIAQTKKRKKDPTADTSFLKDTEREHQELALRTELIEEYKKQQEQVKQEMIEVTYSYWDGSGHRRSIKVTKGARMDQFLEKCRREL